MYTFYEMLILYSDVPLQELLRKQRVKYLPVNKDCSQRVVIRRKHFWEDALQHFVSGLDERKYIKVTFVFEPAVDNGGPLREFFLLLLRAISQKNSLFCGSETSRVPVHNMLELKTYFHIGVMIATSIIHGGPSPKFFAPFVADYFVYGLSGVRATPSDISDFETQLKILKVFMMLLFVYL